MKQFIQKVKTFLIECRRVLKVTRKPTKAEFKVIVKVSALGMMVIGTVGFIIQMVATYIK